MTRCAVLAAGTAVSPFGAADARLQGFRKAFELRGWSVTELSQRVIPSRAGVTPTALSAVLALARWFGITDEIRPKQAVALTRRVRSQSGAVMITSVPPFSLLALTLTARRPVIIDLRDVFSIPSATNPLARLLGPVERALLRRAAGVVYAGSARVGDSLADKLGIPATRLRHVPNGVLVGDLADVRRTPPTRGPLDLVLAGHLYGGMSLDPLLSAVAAVGTDVAQLEVIGPTPGTQRSRFGSRAGPAVTFSDARSRPDLYRRLARADAGVVVLNSSYPYRHSIPTKAYEYCAVGLPVLYVGPSDAALVTEALGPAVRQFPPSDRTGLSEFLRAAVANRSVLATDLARIGDIDRVVHALAAVDLAEMILAQERTWR